MTLPQTVLDYLATQRIGVLAVELLDGAPHAATVHFAHVVDPLRFYFETYRQYRKAEPLLAQAQTRASLVIGVDEGNLKTLQLDGIVRVIAAKERADFDAVYFGKFPDKHAKANEPRNLFFTFIPTWWRFTDWTGAGGKVIVSSDL